MGPRGGKGTSGHGIAGGTDAGNTDSHGHLTNTSADSDGLQIRAPEEPDAGMLHVRICGGPGWVTTQVDPARVVAQRRSLAVVLPRSRSQLRFHRVCVTTTRIHAQRDSGCPRGAHVRDPAGPGPDAVSDRGHAEAGSPGFVSTPPDTPGSARAISGATARDQTHSGSRGRRSVP